MEHVTRERIAAAISSATDEKQSTQLSRLSESDSREPYFLYINDHEAFIELMSVFDRDTISADQVLGFDFQAYEGTDLRKMSVEFDGKISLEHLLTWIGDTNMMGEFPNNFKIRLIIKIDNETAALVTEEVDAQPNVCDECIDTEEFAEDTLHSCGHVSDEITITNTVYIVRMLSDDEKSTYLTFG